jgi:hypothetical protein
MTAALMKFADRVPFRSSRFDAPAPFDRIVPLLGSTDCHHTIFTSTISMNAYRQFGSRRNGSSAIDAASRQYGPCDPRHFIGERDGHDKCWALGE